MPNHTLSTIAQQQFEPRLRPSYLKIIRFMVMGMGYKQIAWAMGITAGSVAQYFNIIYLKLGINNEREMVKWACERPWIVK